MSRYVNAFLSGYRQLNVISNNFETVSLVHELTSRPSYPDIYRDEPART